MEDTKSPQAIGTGKACFTNQNYYPRRIVLTHIESKRTYELSVNRQSSSCKRDIPSGDYVIDIYTTFTKKKIKSFEAKVKRNGTLSKILDVNHYN